MFKFTYTQTVPALLVRSCRLLMSGLVLSALLSSCAALLGVEDAVCDPNFDGECDAQNSTGTTDTSSDEDSGAEEELDDLCEEYCEDVIDACEEFPQFKNESGCFVVCTSAFRVATSDRDNDNTVECRIEAAANAFNFSDGVAENCVSAGTMGTACGGACSNYCSLMESFCPEEFATFGDCEDECRDVPRSNEPYVDGFPAGNTLECRFQHIQLSSADAPNRLAHCSHAAGRSLCAD